MSGGPKYVNQFEFPSSFGFTGSAHDRVVTTVRSHERKKPQRFAKGGKVFSKPANPKLSAAKQQRLSVEQTMRGGIRRRREQALGLKKGGKAHMHRMSDGSMMKNSAMKKGGAC